MGGLALRYEQEQVRDTRGGSMTRHNEPRICARAGAGSMPSGPARRGGRTDGTTQTKGATTAPLRSTSAAVGNEPHGEQAVGPQGGRRR